MGEHRCCSDGAVAQWFGAWFIFLRCSHVVGSFPRWPFSDLLPRDSLASITWSWLGPLAMKGGQGESQLEKVKERFERLKEAGGYSCFLHTVVSACQAVVFRSGESFVTSLLTMIADQVFVQTVWYLTVWAVWEVFPCQHCKQCVVRRQGRGLHWHHHGVHGGQAVRSGEGPGVAKGRGLPGGRV